MHRALAAYYNIKADPIKWAELQEKRRVYNAERRRGVYVPNDVAETSYVTPFDKRDKREVTPPNVLPWVTMDRLMARR